MMSLKLNGQIQAFYLGEVSPFVNRGEHFTSLHLFTVMLQL